MSYGTITYAIEGQAPLTSELRPGVTTLGAGADNDVVLASQGVATYHARLISTPEDAWVMSLEHPEGTFLNQVRLRPNARYPLRDGDTLRIGPYFVRYNRLAPEADDLTRLTRAAPGEGFGTRRPSALPPDVVARLAEGGSGGQRQTSRLPARRLRGNRARPPAIQPGGFDGLPSSYAQYLPPIYQESEFMGRFLRIFEAVLGPIETQIDQIYYYFDPRTAPESLLPWLASWVDLVLNEQWPLEKRRALIMAATELYRWRGTRRGLIEYIRIYTGFQPTIIDLDEQVTDDEPLPPHVFRVILEVPDPAAFDRRLIAQIIEAEKPAHTGYILEIRARAADRSRKR